MTAVESRRVCFVVGVGRSPHSRPAFGEAGRWPVKNHGTSLGSQLQVAPYILVSCVYHVLISALNAGVYCTAAPTSVNETELNFAVLTASTRASKVFKSNQHQTCAARPRNQATISLASKQPCSYTYQPEHERSCSSVETVAVARTISNTAVRRDACCDGCGMCRGVCGEICGTAPTHVGAIFVFWSPTCHTRPAWCTQSWTHPQAHVQRWSYSSKNVET